MGEDQPWPGLAFTPPVDYARCNCDTFAEDLRKLITQLNLQQFSLVGFSMGGAEIARYFLRDQK